jgi:hypothetical protein
MARKNREREWDEDGLASDREPVAFDDDAFVDVVPPVVKTTYRSYHRGSTIQNREQQHQQQQQHQLASKSKPNLLYRSLRHHQPSHQLTLASPIRRHGMYVQMFFQDALRKFNYHQSMRNGKTGSSISSSSSSNNSSSSSSYRSGSGGKNISVRVIPSLKELACYAIGSEVDHLPEVEEQEELYEFIPSVYRRYPQLSYCHF